MREEHRGQEKNQEGETAAGRAEENDSRYHVAGGDFLEDEERVASRFLGDVDLTDGEGEDAGGDQGRSRPVKKPADIEEDCNCGERKQCG